MNLINHATDDEERDDEIARNYGMLPNGWYYGSDDGLHLFDFSGLKDDELSELWHRYYAPALESDFVEEYEKKHFRMGKAACQTEIALRKSEKPF